MNALARAPGVAATGAEGGGEGEGGCAEGIAECEACAVGRPSIKSRRMKG